MDTENIKNDPLNRQTATGPGSTTPQDFMNRGSEAYDETKRSMGRAYDKTRHEVSEKYDQAMDYGREHPGRMILIAFGAGFGLGLMLAGTASTSRRTPRRYAEPIVHALSDIAIDYFRRRW